MKKIIISLEILKEPYDAANKLAEEMLCTRSFIHRTAMKNFLDENIEIKKITPPRLHPRRPVIFAIPENYFKKLKEVSKSNKISMSSIHRQALDIFLSKNKDGRND